MATTHRARAFAIAIAIGRAIEKRQVARMPGKKPLGLRALATKGAVVLRKNRAKAKAKKAASA